MSNSDNSRRNFLKLSAAGMAIAGTSSVSLGADTESVKQAKSQDVVSTVDVLVVGGGSAGTIAAIQAGSPA